MSTSEFSWLFSWFLAVIPIAILIKWLVETFSLAAQLPPGPWGLPIVGYFPWTSSKHHEDFVEIAKKYGGMFSIKLGRDTVVVLNDWPSIKACLLDQPKVFTGRPSSIIDDAGYRKDMAFSDGPVWAQHRVLATQCLNKAGMGKKSLESHIMESIREMMETLTRHDKKIIEMETVFFVPLMKVNWKLIANQQIGSRGKEFQQFDADIGCLYKQFRVDNPLNYFYWLRYLPPYVFRYIKMLNANKRVLNLLRKTINEHKNNLNENSEGADFIDHYLNRIKQKEETDSKAEPPFCYDNLLGSIWILFLAGVDTSNSTSLWGFLYLAHNPDVQKKAQKEMDAVVGRERLPTISDFARLPYMRALVMEIHRLSSVVPLSVSHSNTQTTTLNGFTLPKGTTCIQNIYGVHRDPSLWEEPERFNPDRFLTEEGEVKTPPYLMPFSLGPRSCIGRPLAEMELKLIFSCILHRFSFSFPNDRPKPKFESDLGLVVRPQPYSLLIHARDN